MYQIINQHGIQEIAAWLADHMIGGADLMESQKTAWAADAEFQLGEGNPPVIELRSTQSVSGHTETFTVSPAGITEVTA